MVSGISMAELFRDDAWLRRIEDTSETWVCVDTIDSGDTLSESITDATVSLTFTDVDLACRVVSLVAMTAED